MYTRIALAIILLHGKIFAFSQDSSAIKRKLTLSGYADLYYQYDFNRPNDNTRPPFLFNFKKHDRFSVNMALVKASFETKKIKTNLGIMTGDYSTNNLAPEPEFWRPVYEANIGYKFSEKISADAGIFPSHIGCESAIAKDNWNLSRSLLAENSPYYETGIKLNYKPNKNWTFSVLGLQGWQNIKDQNSSKAFGTQVIFTPNEKIIFNSSSFIGNEKPDSAKQLRLFHNLYFSHTISEKLKTLFVVDLGAERRLDRQGYNKWMGTALLLQYAFAKKFALAARGEFFKDRNGVIISNYLPSKFETTGLAIGLDHQPLKYFVFRGEIRYLHSADKVFIRNTIPVQSNFSILTSVAVFF